MDRRRVVAGFVAAVALLATLVYGVGVDRVAAPLATADPVALSLAPVAGLSTFGLWAGSTWALGRRVDGFPRRGAFWSGYFTGAFLRGIAPWGRTGGSVITAYTLARRGRAPFDRILGTLVASEFLNAVATLNAALAAAGYLAVVGSAGDGALPFVGVMVATAFLLAAVGFVVVRRPAAVARAALAVTDALGRTVGRASATVADVLERDRVSDSLDRFLDSVRGVATDRSTLAASLAFAQAAALVGALPLYVSLLALGETVPFPVVVFAVQAAGIAASVPLPGGTGGVEATLGGLLAVSTGLDLGTIGAGVLLARLSTYWLALCVSGAGTLVLSGWPITVETTG